GDADRRAHQPARADHDRRDGRGRGVHRVLHPHAHHATHQLRAEMRTAMQQKNEKLRRIRRGRGMTMIEIMVVLLVPGLITGAIGFNVCQSLKDAQIKTARLDLQALSHGVDLYHVETGNWPDTVTALTPKFVREVRKDPWGNDYQYVRTGDGYDVYSYGPDKAQGGGDDITIHGGESTTPTAQGAK